MNILFILAAIFCFLIGLLFWFFPDVLIRMNDWLTEKTLTHDRYALFIRIQLGAIFMLICVVFLWAVFTN
jgi:hypothetical protein